jgi:antitoxin (DNA-binding transcriptional repressor) of toxin-antitoxin stability system
MYTSAMRTAQISELKDRIDEVIQAVRQGEIVDIREGETSVAELVPSMDDDEPADSTLGQHLGGVAPPKRHDDPEALFLANLPLIDAVIAYVCGRHRLSEEETETFTTAAKIKLSENGYAIFRRFAYKASLPTYLTIVLNRYLFEQMVARRQRHRAHEYDNRTTDRSQTALERNIDKLVLEGKARKGTGKLPADFFTRPLPQAKKSVLEQLLEDRRTGR